MTTDDKQPTPFTDEELGLAQNSEQQAMNEAQLAHLNTRVVSLRANLDRALAENAVLREELGKFKKPADRKPGATKKAAARRPAAKKTAPAKP